jgi:hypothetical protein
MIITREWIEQQQDRVVKLRVALQNNQTKLAQEILTEIQYENGYKLSEMDETALSHVTYRDVK